VNIEFRRQMRLEKMIRERRQMRLEKMIREHWEPFERLAERRDEIVRSLPWAVMTRAAVVAEVDARVERRFEDFWFGLL
jgi:hypothetical protein